MSPRRPRVPRVDPATGAPRRTAPSTGAPRRTDPERTRTPEREGTPSTAAEAETPAPASDAPAPDAPAPDTPAGRSERPATAKVIDLQRAQDRRQAGHDRAHDRSSGAAPAAEETGPAGPSEGAAPQPTTATAPASASRPAPASRPAASARPAGRRPRPAPRRALSPAAAAARRRAPLPDPVPARQITGRSLVVVAVLLVAAVLVAPTLRAFLNQQLEISAAREDIAVMQAQREDYEERLRLWDDPGYVTQQARERLELVMPGETLYSVTGVPEDDAEDPLPETPGGEAVNTRLPWAEGLWDSAVRAGLE